MRVSLQPRDAPNDPTKDGTGLTIGEYRVVGTYRAPRAVFGGDGTLTAAAEQGIRSSFSFTRQGLNADTVRRLTPTTRLTARYSLNSTHTFNERLSEEDQATIDRLFPRVRLSTISGAVARDTRDDVLDPERGTFMSAEGSLATRALGGQVGFMKTYLQVFWFHRLPGRRRIVFASRATSASPTVSSGQVRTRTATRSHRRLARQRTLFRRRRHEHPRLCARYGGRTQYYYRQRLSKGGNAVLILNGELRIPVWREFGTALVHRRRQRVRAGDAVRPR